MAKNHAKKPINKKKAFKKSLKIFFVGAILAFIAGIFTIFFIGFGIYVSYSREFSKIKPQSNSTQLVMYDREGNEFFRGYGAAEPQRIPLADIPDVVKKSTLAAEDADFYKHGPVDFRSIARSVYDNWQASDKQGLSKVADLFKEDSYVKGGGSTITQQLVKNIYLTSEKSWQRKLKEIIYAFNLERRYTKDQILEMYLNEIYYGHQSIGIQNSAHTYFDKDVKELTLSEASMLAGLPQAPSYYDPMGDNYDQSKKRQEYVLQKMLLSGDIDLETAKEAANAPLDFYGKSTTLNKYPFYAEYVKEELIKKLGLDNIDNTGYKVYTTLDSRKQEAAEKNMKSSMARLSNRGASNSASVIQDPKTGEILAMVGGVDWEKSKVNVATSERQPGSSFKPIVYATAFENGYTAATILNDKLVNFGGIPPYMPRNYNGSFSGYLTVRNALARSLNVPAVEMGKLVGIDKVIDMAHELGITSINNKPEDYGLSLSLGTGEVKLVDMVSAYSTFANGGKRIPQTVLIRVVDDKNNEIQLPKRKEKSVISEETAFILSSILSDNNARSATFGSNSPLKTDKITAVKTGTTDNYADSWTVGYSPDLVVGVWMGNNDRTPMKRVSGVEGAAYIWHDIITECLKDAPNNSFTPPANIVESWINPRTGALATRPSRPNVLEYFKAGTVPTDKANLLYLKQF
jgi:1A family penicillin-binding protein